MGRNGIHIEREGEDKKAGTSKLFYVLRGWLPAHARVSGRGGGMGSGNGHDGRLCAGIE